MDTAPNRGLLEAMSMDADYRPGYFIDRIWTDIRTEEKLRERFLVQDKIDPNKPVYPTQPLVVERQFGR